MKVTYYLEVTSSWCFWAEPVWAELKARYVGRVDFTWKIARMQQSDWPLSRAQCDWFYRRSGTVMRSPFMLNSGWFEPVAAGGYPAASYVAEAARTLGFQGDGVRLALSHAGEREGEKIGQIAVATAVAAKASGINARKLRTRAESPQVAALIDASTKEFFAHQITQRPAFVLEDDIGDKAVFSGLARLEPLAATIEAMLADTTAYASYKAHFGGPPSS